MTFSPDCCVFYGYILEDILFFYLKAQSVGFAINEHRDEFLSFEIRITLVFSCSFKAYYRNMLSLRTSVYEFVIIVT